MKEQIKAIRDKLKLSPKEIETKFELPENSWIDLESGVSEVPVKLLKKFIHIGFSLGWLISGNGQMFIIEEEEAVNEDKIISDDFRKKQIEKRLEEIEIERKFLLEKLKELSQ